MDLLDLMPGLTLLSVFGYNAPSALQPRRVLPLLPVSAQTLGQSIGLLVIGSFSEVSPLGVLVGVPRSWLAGILLQGL